MGRRKSSFAIDWYIEADQMDFPPLTGPKMYVRRCLHRARAPNFRVVFDDASYEPESPFGPLLISPCRKNNASLDEGWEVQGVFPGEVRLLAALMIAWPPSFGKLNFYPARYPLKVQLPENITLDILIVFKWLWKYLGEAPYSHVQGALEDKRRPDVSMGDPFDARTRGEFKHYANWLYARISSDDKLLLRGMYHMVKAQMLMSHPEFMDSAALELYVAMAASYELFADELRRKGNTDPSNADVVARFEDLYKVNLPGGQYFGDYYTDRIRCIHPVARGEIAISPPLAVDDVYHLYPDLLRVFEYFVAGRPEEHYARYRFYWENKAASAKEELMYYRKLVPDGIYCGEFVPD
jgi:hypothetical protein